MIYRIRNEFEWSSFVHMMQTRFQRDMKPWDSIQQAGEFSQTTDLCLELQALDTEAVDIDEHVLQTGVFSIQDEYDQLRDELAEQGDKAREIQLCEEYDKAVCELIMKTVRPRYPILLSVDVLHLHGDVRSNIDELILMIVAQRDGTPPESPSKLPHRMWREQGNRTPEEFVEEMKKDPGQWTATQDGVGGIRVDDAVSSVCVAVKTKLEFVCCRCYQGDLWRVSWQEGNRKIGINVARIKDAETVEE